ncbi:MAG: hypothetical protein JST04_09660 [Bdellovibrionales bacterium]|nr:hypothetical protein [Bdellovibrionales bacterium]
MMVSPAFTAFVVTLAIGIAVPRSAHAVATSAFYAGNVSFSSPDGANALGGTTSLVKRVTNRAKREIVETVYQPPKHEGGSMTAIVTHLKRKGSSNVFEASDEGKTFRGTVTFEGPEWKWTRWTYAIDMLAAGEPNGMTVSGEGEISPYAIKTSKTLSDANGDATLLVREELGRVTPAEFEKLKGEMGVR